ncbi:MULTISPECIES: carboxymuconolactone decarboxylase family protein [unclassified Microbacterium]|uniref:carboxymuconolactone decarboxylase family protein n=1 Tax=unclassified Microbacterium TaxID=2609290 RepID=UPI000C2BBEE9|nr:MULTISPECIES: carboxymuconolactone decarboxylase family protein [unclassified Microbacterium]
MTSTDTHAQTYESGLGIRREVIGADYVERSLASATDFTRPIQELVTEYCWGTVWSREGLGRRERSMINLAMLTALNRGHEFAVHVRGALRNGVSVDEIREVLMQTAIYVGVPAALESFRIAAEAITAYEAETAADS